MSAGTQVTSAVRDAVEFRPAGRDRQAAEG
jgi:hypothetical protein